MAFNPTINTFEKPPELAENAAKFVKQLIIDCAGPAEKVSVALSGGSTPKMMYQHLSKLLSAAPFTAADGWNKRINFVLGDERMVPLDHEFSNFRMAREAFSNFAGQLPSMVELHPVPTTLSANDAAQQYSGALRHLASSSVAGEQCASVPILDVVLLGFGPDGHTASLFPGCPAAIVGAPIADIFTPTMPPMGTNPAVERVSLTPEVIINARHVVVLATGSEKKWVVEGVLQEEIPARPPVARLLRYCRGAVHFFLDAAAVPSALPQDKT